MKQRLVPALIGLALLGMALSVGLNYFRGKSSSPNPSGLDGRLTVTLPPSWSTVESLNPLANLKVGDPKADIYLIVVSEKKSEVQGDNHTLQKYSQNARTRLTASMSGVRQEGPWWVSVGQHRALRYEIYGTAQDGMKVTYVHTIVETPEYFHQVVGWAEASNYPKHRKAIREVADSVREDGR
ncbi:MAG TPA: hypothetical protein VFW62_09545 [bacterium]|nr:hypothetical protein [bacterium]